MVPLKKFFVKENIISLKNLIQYCRRCLTAWIEILFFCNWFYLNNEESCVIAALLVLAPWIRSLTPRKCSLSAWQRPSSARCPIYFDSVSVIFLCSPLDAFAVYFFIFGKFPACRPPIFPSREHRVDKRAAPHWKRISIEGLQKLKTVI